jgi:hypothetical protein
MFAKADLDKSEGLSHDEVEALFEELHIHMSYAQFTKCFAEFDRNQDGKLQRNEFNPFIKACITHQREHERESQERVKTIVMGDNELVDRHGRCSSLSLISINSELAAIDCYINQREQLTATTLTVAMSAAWLFGNLLEKLWEEGAFEKIIYDADHYAGSQ